MIEINLLPKELQHKRLRLSVNKNIILILVGGLAVLAVLVLYSYVFQQTRIAGLKKDIRQAQNETERYAAEIQKIEDITLKKKQILARMSAIQVLDRNRSYWVNVLEDLVRRVPDYVWLTSVEQSPGTPATPGASSAAAPPAAARSTMSGYAFSLNAFATFLIRLKKSDIFKNIELTTIALEETDEAKAYSFKITCSFKSPEMPMALPDTAQTSTATGTQF